MTSLFSEIQGFFDAKYSGRFLALLLRELAVREPASFVAALALPKSIAAGIRREKYEVVHEHRFLTPKGAPRIADLAVLSGGEPIVFIEVKEDDIHSQGNPAQLEDYLSMLQSPSSDGHKIRFVHVSRYAMPIAEQKRLKHAASSGLDVSSIRYRNIYATLSSPRRSVGSWGILFSDFLRDIGVANYKFVDLDPSKDGKGLALLLVQMLGFPHQNGLGRLHSDKAVALGPELMETLMGNLQVLSEWLVDANQEIFNQRFTRKFRPIPYFNLAALSRHELSDTEAPLPGNRGAFVESGTVIFFAQGKISSHPTSAEKLQKNDWLYVEIGYALSISKRRAEEAREGLVQVQMYAQFFGGNNVPDAYSESPGKILFPTEVDAHKQLIKCLRAAHIAGLKNSTGRFQETLKHFVLPPAN